ncbi:YqiJ family protein [Catenovulum sp. SM1970]|uniref:YqiJ family protein n=1 Tax=Marinifaba aquimaris TaxID=2741323 RepID=UPI001574298F|nr:YqiJ family protein [Marinifaba aquimaris]NTS77258.1 YqiJ family protein [Marinifaba aquimaris]
MEFLLADLNLPYSTALAIVLALSFMEGLGVLIGLSLMSFLDNLLDIDIDADAEVSTGGITAFLGWLCLDRLPFLVWLILFLTSFSLIGFSINQWHPLSLNLSVPIALALATLITKILGQKIAKWIPKNETTAASVNDFKGKLATITVGKATKGNAAEAVLKDDFNQKHYVMVEPDHNEHSFEQGHQVVLIEKQQHCWIAVPFK